jgi:dienelactone hydrolase
MAVKHFIVALVVSACSGAVAGESWTDLSDSFRLGPVPPTVDLRNMVTEHIVRKGCATLDSTAQARRDAIASGDWTAWRESVREAVREGLGPLPSGPEGKPLNVRIVSRHERPGYVVENVLFESLPGLDVNASVYLPLKEDFPPPWPGIVVPVGHSCKVRENYQKPAQVFARAGYVAVTFDPPGMAGEKQEGNDHFRDGVRCYLTGHSSNRYFVVDALRCVDYLSTRPDVEMADGVGMTGVSGGGMTTMFATLLDERVKASGPCCCAVPNALHPVLDMYAPCPETLAFGRFQAYDDVDLLVAAMPTPLLLMAGREDEVFTEAMSESIGREVGIGYSDCDHGDRFSFFLDDCGHAYSVPMALEFVKWMDKWVRGTPDRIPPEIQESGLEMLSAEMLACHPRQDRNVFSVNQGVAKYQREHRSGMDLKQAVLELANVEGENAVPEARLREPSQAWFHFVQELVLSPEPGIELPGTFFWPTKENWKGAALLYFDDRGRWTDLRTQGLLSQIAGFIDRETDGPAVLTVDLRGWGDTRPADVGYDIAGWGHRERWNAYVSAALGDPILAMRIRDALSALAYLRSREEVDPDRIVVGGRGMGGVVALHVATIDSRVTGVFSAEGPISFECLATSEPYSWSPEAFFPGVLEHCDLPELVAGFAMPTLIVNPLGPMKEPIGREEAERLYETALSRNEGMRLETGASDDAIRDSVREFLAE